MINNTKLSSLEETRSEFNPGQGAIKLGIDVHQDYYVVVAEVEGSNPKPAQRVGKAAFLRWAEKLRGRAARRTRFTKRAVLALGCSGS